MARQRMSSEAKEATPGPGAMRFSIPGAYEDGGGLIVEVRAYEMGPRGGAGQEVRLTREYWRGLLPKLATKV
jgi:hypothetical protein